MEAPPVYSAPPEAPYKKRPNTLLWVVLALVGLCACSVPILAAILFPVFSQAKISAQRTTCLSNVQMLATAHVMYATDNDDRFPPAKSWMDKLKPYSRESDRDLLRCPSVKDGHGYAMADAMSGKNLNTLANPESSVLLFETPDLAYNAHGDPKSVTEPPRHGSNSTAFADGSTRSIRPGPNRR